MTVAIIAARTGSKRLEGKNIKPFCGVPLVAWSIIQARCAGLIDKVYLTTDGDEIAEVGKAFGAEIIRRPHWDDAAEACSLRPFRHAIQTISLGASDRVVTMLPPHVLRKPEDLDMAIAVHRDYGCDVVVGMIPQRETILYEIKNFMTGRLSIWDKTNKYGKLAGGFEVSTVGNYMHRTRVKIDTDAALDARPMSDYARLDQYFIKLQPWQDHDTDTLEEFEMAEMVCKKYLPGGTGEYEMYAKGEI